MAQYYLNLHGYYLYYEEELYASDRDAFDYLESLNENEIKTLFDAAYADGGSEFKTTYGNDYRIIYDYSNKMYTLAKPQ